MPQRRRLAGILAGAPNLITAAGFALSFWEVGGVPKSVVAALGWLSDPFMVLMMVSVTAAGILAIPQHPRMLYAEGAARPLAAAMLLSYVVALLFSNTSAWITVGLSTAMAVEQLRRWHVIVTILVPEARAVALLRSEMEEGAH